MEKRSRAVIDPAKFDAVAFEAFMQEVEELGLARFENGEIIYEEENGVKLQEIMDKHMLK
ncbi:MAG: hypothetical protein IJZ31_06940 [Bacteroidaceae bacterium]|nr:hypothetical protein [Bacteroidaceae bacterium]